MAAPIYEYQGVVEKVLDLQTVGANGFRKRSVILTDDTDSFTNYPSHIEFTAKQDRVNLLEPLRNGQRVKVRFAIDSRVWRNAQGVDVYFKDLTILNLEQVGSAEGAGEASAPAAPGVPTPPEMPAAASDPDDLPF